MASVRDTLLTLHLTQFTGKIVLKKDEVEKIVFFRKGNPIFVDSTIRSETLGQILLEKGRLSQAQYLSVIEKMQESGKRQGEIIVELGILTGFEVFEALTEQAARKVQNCFLLEGARIDTEQGDEHLQNVPELQIDFFRTYLDLAYSTYQSEENSNLFPGDKAVKVTDNGVQYVTQCPLQAHESRLVRLSNGKKTLSEIVESAGGDTDESAIFLQVLHSLNFIEFTEPPPKRFSMPAAEVKKEEEKRALATPKEPSAERRVITIGEEQIEPPKKSSPIYTWALRMDRPHHDLLNIQMASNRFEAKRNYDSIIRELHLDALDQHYEGKELKIAEALFDRLTLALTVLSDDKRKQNYYRSLSKRDGSKNEPTPEILAEACAQKAKILAGRKQYAKAAEELKKAMEHAPKDSSYHVEMADLLLHQALSEKKDPPSEVENELREAIKLNSSDERAFFQLGAMAKLKGDVEKAKGYFNKVISLKPNHMQASAELRLMQRREEEKGSQSMILNLFKKK